MPPAPLDSFVGRGADLDRLGGLLEGDSRVVVVTGPGGIGKTRLCRELLSRLEAELPCSCFCDLSAVREPDGLCTAVASALHVRTDPSLGQTLSDWLGEQLADRGPLLLALDNFEQLVEGCTDTLLELLERAPELRLFVTSRDRVPVPGAVTHTLLPMPGQDAVTLFLDRVRERTSERWTTDREEVTGIVDHLDGLPLAIELAAARAPLLGPKQMRERLERDLSVLGDASSRRPTRHATLHATFEWSWNLLSESEQRTLAECSVFRNAFRLEDAEAVLSSEGDELPVLDRLQQLADRSLLLSVNDARGTRQLRMLVAVRELAETKLSDARREEVAERHASHFAAACPDLVGRAEGRDCAAALDRLAETADDLLAGYEWAMGHDGPETSNLAGQLATGLYWLMWFRGPLMRFEQLVGRLLDGRAPADPKICAELLLNRANTRRRQGNLTGSEADVKRGIALASQLDDERLLARLLRLRGLTRLLRGHFEEAERLYDEALEIQNRLGDRLEAGVTLSFMGSLARLRLRLDDAEGYLGRALQLLEEEGNLLRRAVALVMLGNVHGERQEYDAAMDAYLRAEKLASQANYLPCQANASANRALMALDLGRCDEARALLDAAFVLYRSFGDRPMGSIMLGCRAILELFENNFSAARECIERGRSLMGPIPNREQTVLLVALDGVLRIIDGRAPQGRALLDTASAQVGGRDNPVLGPTIRLLSAYARACRLDECPSQRGELAAVCLEARASFEQHDLYYRLALRLLEGALANAGVRLEDLSEDTALLVEETGHWFQLHGNPPSRLKAGSPARRLLATLARARRDRRGESLTSRELVQTIWPAERILPSAARNRLHVALSTLRGAGLREAIQKGEHGYRLDPDLPLLLQTGDPA